MSDGVILPGSPFGTPGDTLFSIHGDSFLFATSSICEAPAVTHESCFLNVITNDCDDNTKSNLIDLTGIDRCITGVDLSYLPIITGSTEILVIDPVTGHISISETIGYLGVPQNIQISDYTTVMSDAGKHLYHPTGDTTARSWTIDSNMSVPYPIGTAITFVNDTSAGDITINIISDTLVFAGSGLTGSRILTANGIATALKITPTRWIISGTNLS